MRLVTVDGGGGPRPGILVGEKVVDTGAVARRAGIDGELSSNRQVVALGAEALQRLAGAAQELAGEGSPVAGARLGPPIPDPDKIICMGLNYRDHAAESGMDLPTVPMFFPKYRSALVGPADEVVLPAAAPDKVDYEAELAVVIGRRCKGVSAEEALDYVAGAMVFNDVSARDLQLEVGQWMMGKAIDTFAPCGPALVTLDEAGDIQKLGIRCRVNGEALQDGDTSLMVFTAAEGIAFASRALTLEPGDIIATGTPAGVGQSRNPPVWLHDGDVVETEIDNLGTLRNRVIAGR
jgi:2-keto-4-pentenoate hydratase/2-oxohepta-3-ene-1,7-dioic acid hydratase in catechol pathway